MKIKNRKLEKAFLINVGKLHFIMILFAFAAYYQEPSIIDRNCADSLIKDSKTLNEIMHSRKSINDQVYEDVLIF